MLVYIVHPVNMFCARLFSNRRTCLEGQKGRWILSGLLVLDDKLIIVVLYYVHVCNTGVHEQLESEHSQLKADLLEAQETCQVSE